jgi:hypothetical protein
MFCRSATVTRTDGIDDIDEVDNPQEPEPYCYQKLLAPDECIRLLTLQLGTGNQEIICELVDHNPSDKTETSCEAFSLSWGSAARNKKPAIRCGISTFSSMIPPNLLEALAVLRLQESVRICFVHQSSGFRGEKCSDSHDVSDIPSYRESLHLARLG